MSTMFGLSGIVLASLGSLAAGERVVIVVGADPIPHVRTVFVNEDCSIPHCDRHRPTAVSMLSLFAVLEVVKPKTWMTGVRAEKPKREPRELFDLGRQRLE